MFGNSNGVKRASTFDIADWCVGSVDSDSKKKKKKSRWNTEDDDKTIIPGMPTAIPQNLSKEQEEQYIVHLQIEEISRKLRSGDLGIPSNIEARSPSPEPIYNSEGKRLNTREYRTRRRLEDERHQLVVSAWKLNPSYKPPMDYKPPIVRVSDKVTIPQDDHPDINFVGLLIGPRGNTLKHLEKDTGAKIIIRGKGSVKEGKIGRKDGQPLPGEDEPLHAYITANNAENVKIAVDKIKEIIREGIEVPEGQNDLRRQQLRELALLNGTLRENDALVKLKQVEEAQTIITNTILCSICGCAGHISHDCKEKKSGGAFCMVQLQTPTDRAKMDSEYMSLMAELGEGPPPQSTPGTPLSTMQRLPIYHRHVPPNPMAFNSPWQQRQPQRAIAAPPPVANSPFGARVPPQALMRTVPPSIRMTPPPVAMLSSISPQALPAMQPWQHLLTAQMTAQSLMRPASLPMGVPPPSLPMSGGQAISQSAVPWNIQHQSSGAGHCQPHIAHVSATQHLAMAPPIMPSILAQQQQQTASSQLTAGIAETQAAMQSLRASVAPWQATSVSMVPPPPWQQQPVTALPSQPTYMVPPAPPQAFDFSQSMGAVGTMVMAPPPPPPPN